jgi:predicted RNA-binding protein Jag
MSVKDEYLPKAQAAMTKIQQQIDELRVQADLAQAEARDRLQKGIEELRKRQGEVKVKLDEAQKAGADTWQVVSAQAEQAVSELGDVVSNLTDELQKAGGAAQKGWKTFLDEWNKARSERKEILDKG